MVDADASHSAQKHAHCMHVSRVHSKHCQCLVGKLPTLNAAVHVKCRVVILTSCTGQLKASSSQVHRETIVSGLKEQAPAIGIDCSEAPKLWLS